MGLFTRATTPAANVHRTPQGYEKHRKDAAARQRRLSAAGRDIGPIPPIENEKRRKKALQSLEFFGKTYFPKRFDLPLAKFHKGYIRDLERIVKSGGKLAVAMPRSSGKSAWAEVAVLWAIFRGDHNYVLLVAATQPMARKQLGTLRTLLLATPGMAADFPEICYPLRCHCGVNQKRILSQGRPLEMRITSELILCPNVPGSPAAEAIIECIGLGGAIRGRAFERNDGRKARPTLVILDDPQTKATAKSPKQTDDREALIKADIEGLPPPDCQIAVIIPCTVIYPDDLADRLLDREKNPAYNGRREKLLDSLPSELELWNKFQEVRAEGMRAGDGGAAGTKYYRQNRAAMDAGACATWPERFKPGQLSAIQYGMEIYFDSRQTFFSEYQNDPAGAIEEDGATLQAEDLMRRSSGLRRGRLSTAMQYVAAGLDVHVDLLYSAIVAAHNDPTLSVIDYATWPKQVLGYFTKRAATRTMLNHPDLKNLDPEERLFEGLERAADEIFAQTLLRENGEQVHVGLIVVDARYMTKVVTDWCKKSKHRKQLLAAMGSPKLEIFNGRVPPSAEQGVDYFIPQLGNKWPVRVASVNSNAWITRTHAGFLTPLGAKGAWTLFEGENPETHRCFADHITAEFATDYLDKRTGQTLRLWKPKPDHPDNHWLDATKMAALGCFKLGCRLAYSGQEAVKTKSEPRFAFL